ncbi:MAG: MFS transporter [Acidobacteriota bacterium]
MSKPRSGLLIALAYAGFISLGMPDGLLGVAWPSMRASFGLPVNALGSLLVFSTIGYLLSSSLTGWLLARMSVGTLLTLSCLATSASLFGYAFAPSWWVLISFGLLSGLGAGAIDAGLNTYVATFHSARTVNWLHAFYGIATTSGPALMTAVLASGRVWQFGYAIVAAGQFALALCFGLTRKLWPKPIAPDKPKTQANALTIPTAIVWRMPAVWLSVAVFFVYCGIEAAAGAWPYSLFTEARGVSMTVAGSWASAYWGCFTVGRVISGFAANHISTRWLLRVCVAGIAFGALLLWVNVTSLLSFIGIALIGLACAPIFPTMIATTPKRIGQKYVATAVGLQISAAVLGQSLLPSFVGVMAGKFGLEVLAPMLLAAALLLFLLTEVLYLSSREPAV